MSLEMAEQSDFDHSGLQEVANSIRDPNSSEETANNSQKRKRGSLEEGSADERRPSFKRTSPPTSSGGEGNDASGSSYMQADGSEAVENLENYNMHQEAQNGDHATNASSTAAAALAGIYPTMTIPQPTDVSFATQGSEERQEGFLENNQESFSMEGSSNNNQSSGRGSANKPAVGSEEWHKVRKDNHKEVERRRRETINEGINELAKIVPGCEKNKGSILQRAVSFITQLKENEAQNIEKWTLEKLLTEQAIAELSASNDKLKTECERAWREVETWKKTCQSAGLKVKEGEE